MKSAAIEFAFAPISIITVGLLIINVAFKKGGVNF